MSRITPANDPLPPHVVRTRPGVNTSGTVTSDVIRTCTGAQTHNCALVTAVFHSHEGIKSDLTYEL